MEQCKAIIRFGDDYGDNCTTFHCQLEKGHEGEHSEMGYQSKDMPYTLIWQGTSDHPHRFYDDDDDDDDDTYGDYVSEEPAKEDKPEEPDPYQDLVDKYDPEVLPIKKYKQNKGDV